MKPRENWGSRIGFLLATAGSAIGLGSLWKFPYVTGENGGGLFVLAYVFFTFLIGIPIFIAELVLGRKAERSPVLAFGTLSTSQDKNWRLLGWSCVLANFLVLSYYSVVAGWSLNYAFMSLLNFTEGKSSEDIREVFNLLYVSADMNLLWNFLFLAITVGVVFRGIRKGIEFWSKILTPALLIILLALLFYSMTLEGFSEAFHFIFYPDPSKLKASGLLQALGLACFTLSVGLGIILTYGSYMQKHEDIAKTAVTIGIVDILVSLCASLMIFPIIFTFGLSPQEGPGLLFKTLPVLFAKLPGTMILSTTFFLLVVFAALTSTISIMEVIVATFIETLNWTRGKAAIVAGVTIYIIGIPSALAGSNTIFKNWLPMYGKNFFDSVDYFSFAWLLPINGVLTAVFAGWILDKAARRSEFEMGSNMKRFYTSWLFIIKWVAPVAVLLIMLQSSGLINFDSLFKLIKK